MYRCRECGKTFPAYATIETEKKGMSFTPSTGRVYVRKPCCPYCESIEIELEKGAEE